MNSVSNDFISYIRFQSENYDIINIFIYNQHGENKYKNTSRSNLKKLDIKPYRRCILNINGQDRKIECCICYEDVKQNEYIRELNCNHQFHKKCIDKWLISSMKCKEYVNCPVCRTIINLI
jgi:hypothetical protein